MPVGQSFFRLGPALVFHLRARDRTQHAPLSAQQQETNPNTCRADSRPASIEWCKKDAPACQAAAWSHGQTANPAHPSGEPWRCRFRTQPRNDRTCRDGCAAVSGSLTRKLCVAVPAVPPVGTNLAVHAAAFFVADKAETLVIGGHRAPALRASFAVCVALAGAHFSICLLFLYRYAMSIRPKTTSPTPALI